MAHTTNIIKHGKSDFPMFGPYAVFALNDNGKVIASVTGIRTPATCDERALEYAQAYGAEIKTPMLAAQTRRAPAL